MAEETLTEALSKLDSEEDISRAALPEGRRVEEEVQEDFETAEPNTEEELSEVEVKARTAQNRINQAVKQAKEYQRRELQALQYAK